MRLKSVIGGLVLGGVVAVSGIAAGPAMADAPTRPAVAADNPAVIGWYNTLRACQVDGRWYVQHTSGASTYDCARASDGKYLLFIYF